MGLHAHLKHVARPWVEARHASAVVRGIFDGTLDPRVMRRWLEQDHIYLQTYARVLARLAALAPDRHMATLIDGAHYTVHTEVDRLTRLAGLFDADFTDQDIGSACADYVDYLTENSARFETGVVAVLPCMIGFAALGLTVEVPPEPRYRQWIEIYSESDFQGYAARFEAIVDDIDLEQLRAEEVFERGMAMEQALWDEAAVSRGTWT
jgi:thiaminase/transcriptional activator TenA